MGVDLGAMLLIVMGGLESMRFTGIPRRRAPQGVGGLRFEVLWRRSEVRDDETRQQLTFEMLRSVVRR